MPKFITVTPVGRADKLHLNVDRITSYQAHPAGTFVIYGATDLQVTITESVRALELLLPKI